jgi:DNA-binding response OmpR family regulator
MSDKKRILVAEDDAGIRELIRTHLRMAGYDIYTARTGVEALEAIGALDLHAAVLDINMPELDGFGVLEALRPPSIYNRIPILVLTARHGGDDVRRAVRLGAKDYLTKPFSQIQLVSRVARLLRQPMVAHATGIVVTLVA